MPLLPTNVSAGTTGHIGHSNQAYGKLNDHYPNIVRDFGADPTGSVDATSIIQSAITTLGENSDLFWPRGLYKVSDQGSGFCLDLGTKNGIHWVGPGQSRGNASGETGGATIFTSSASSTIVKHDATAALKHYGPFMENLRFEARAADTTCYDLRNFNHARFVNCQFKGNSGTTTGFGLRLEGVEDASYNVVDSCSFHGHGTGIKITGTTQIINSYISLASAGTPIGIRSTQGSGHAVIDGCKFECSTDQTGGYGIYIDGDTNNGTKASNCSFERFGETPAIYISDSGTPRNSSHCFVNIEVNGDGTGGPQIYIGTNTKNAKFIGMNFTNTARPYFTDNGTETIFIGGRPDGGGAGNTGWYAKFGAMRLFVDSGVPTTTGGTDQGDAPVGSLYMRTDGSTSTTLYVKTGASTWTAK